MRALSGALVACLVPAVAHADSAGTLVERGLAAMGGVERVRALRGIKIEGIGHAYHPEQSERPEGPYLIEYDEVVAWRDLAGGRVLTQHRSRGAFLAEWTASTTYTTPTATFRIADAKVTPGALAAFEDDRESLALAPERVLLTALDAKDLRAGGTELAEGLDQDVVAFGWRGRDVRLLLNPYTHLPTLMEVVRERPDNVFLAPWGDVRARTSWGNWQIVSGLRLPLSSWRTINGLPDADFTITRATLDPGDAPWPKVDAAAIAAAEQRVRNGPQPVALSGPGQELAEGIRFYAGRWNTTLVRQEAGVVVLEAPLANELSEAAIVEAGKVFPGAPLAAVVSTSDAWPHIAGLRAYAARKLPLYVFALTVPLVRRLLDAPHATRPDAWEQRRRDDSRAAADIRPVAGKTAIGTGPNRIELYPLRGEGSERMVMAYFPGRKLLYASDLVQPQGDEFFNPVYLTELVAAVAREKLAVDTVFAMHAGPTPWTKVVAAAAKASRPQ